MDPELTTFLTDRFAEVDRQFTEVGRRFDEVHRQFDEVHRRLEGVDRRLDGHDQRFDALDRKIDEKFEEAKRYFGVLAEDLRGQLQTVAEGHLELDRRVTRLERERRKR
ncbi:MAG: hypothetical protein HYV94_11425 [Candidatus Rokubacteria bacterium]|nr:hypothetical protein [Candidatus Rokubacteria bacterium]MBI2492688.1 hypothetical protein [Candidatus Rokubacteria bacterium]